MSSVSGIVDRNRDLSRHPVADRLSWLWLLIAIMVLAVGGLAGGRKW